MATMAKPTIPTGTEQIIRALAQEYVGYHNTRNIEKLVTLFSKDGHLFAPYHPLAQGRDSLRDALKLFMTEYDPRDLKVETTHVEVDGNVAFSFGTFTINLQTPEGTRLDDKGKWIVALRREDGVWRIVGHCYNTDLPITTRM